MVFASLGVIAQQVEIRPSVYAFRLPADYIPFFVSKCLCGAYAGR